MQSIVSREKISCLQCEATMRQSMFFLLNAGDLLTVPPMTSLIKCVFAVQFDPVIILKFCFIATGAALQSLPVSRLALFN